MTVLDMTMSEMNCMDYFLQNITLHELTTHNKLKTLLCNKHISKCVGKFILTCLEKRNQST
jgi:hypothetical protein